MNNVTLRQYRQRELRQTIPDDRTFQLAVIDHPITFANEFSLASNLARSGVRRR